MNTVKERVVTQPYYLLVGGFVAVSLIALSLAPSANAITTSVSSVIGSTISLFTSSGTVNIDATPTAGGVQTIASDTITVSTNDASGYTLKLAETTGTNTLTSGSNTIAASSGSQTTPVVQAANTWGYRVDGVGGFGAGPTSSASNAAISGTVMFAAVPATASPNTLKTTNATASSDTTTVWYGVAVNTSTPSGTYTNSVTYTATAN
jgi:hypothetical protein